MNRKFGFLSLLTSLVLLASCSNTPLREDIKEFVSTFSLTDSVKAYKVAGYRQEERKVRTDTVSDIITELSFDVSDVTTPIYHKNVKSYVNEELKKEEDEYIEIIEDKYYFHSNETTTEYSLEQCHALVEDFFYTQEEVDGTYHLRGHYYGDYILQTCQSFQNFVTIDDEQELYIFEAEQIKKADSGENVNVHQKYEVNKLGMLVTNNVEMISNSLSYYITINVFNTETI